jgi:hypothetical protein
MVIGRQYGTLGIACMSGFVLAVIALHVLDPGRSVVNEDISAYALDDLGWVERVSEVAVGLGTIAVALGLRETLAPGKRATTAWVLILVAGLGSVLSGFFATDPAGATVTTTSGSIHGTASFFSLLATLVAAWTLWRVFLRDTRYRNLARAQLGFAILITLGVLALLVLWAGPVGLLQRLLVVVLVAWMLVLAINLRQVEATRSAN